LIQAVQRECFPQTKKAPISNEDESHNAFIYTTCLYPCSSKYNMYPSNGGFRRGLLSAPFQPCNSRVIFTKAYWHRVHTFPGSLRHFSCGYSLLQRLSYKDLQIPFIIDKKRRLVKRGTAPFS